MAANRTPRPKGYYAWGLASLAALGLWLVVALVFGLAAAGAVWPGFLFGLVSGLPVFFPAHRYVRLAAAWEVQRTEALYERAAGGPDGLAEVRRRTGAALGMDDPGRQRLMARMGQVLRWTPVGLFVFLAVACLVVAAEGEGFAAVMPAELGGMFLGWAILLYRSGVKPPAGVRRSPETQGDAAPDGSDA